MNSKLQQAFNVVVRYGFCGDCKESLGSQFCVGKDCYENCVSVIQDALNSIDAEPVRHGKWIEVKRQDGTIVFQCPHCKDVAYTKNPYCRICGTKMDDAIDGFGDRWMINGEMLV